MCQNYNDTYHKNGQYQFFVGILRKKWARASLLSTLKRLMMPTERISRDKLDTVILEAAVKM